MAILLGANLKDAKWLNPNIANAEAQRIQVEATHQQATYENQERLAAAQTEAEIQQIQRDQKLLDAQYAAEMQKIEQDMVNRQRWADVEINLALFAGGALSIAATIGGLILAIARAISILRSMPKSQPAGTQLRASSNSQPVAVPVKQVVKPVPQHETCEALAQRYERRLAERLQEINAGKKEADEALARISYFTDPARVTKEGYNKLPLAGD